MKLKLKTTNKTPSFLLVSLLLLCFLNIGAGTQILNDVDMVPESPPQLEPDDLIPEGLAKAIRAEVMQTCRDKHDQEGNTWTENIIDCLVQSMHERLRIQNGRENYYSIKIQIEATDDHYNSEAEFDAVLPLTEAGDSSAIFFQPGFILSIKDSEDPKNSIHASLGLVYRFTFHGGVLGLNIFYDRQRGLKSGSIYQQRLGLGYDYQNDRNTFSFNYYYPLEGWKSLNEFYEERALQGMDFRFGRLFSEKIELEGSISYWDSEINKDRTIASLGLNYKINCVHSLGLEAERDFETDETSVFLRHKISWGDYYRNQGKNCLQEQYENQLRENLYQPVQREKQIRVERRRRGPQLFIPDQSVYVGDSFSFTISRTHFNSVKKEENPEILVTSLPDWLTYDKNTLRFYGVATQPGVYDIGGTIALSATNKSLWVFKITVLDDWTTPLLLAEDQTIAKGEHLDYAPVIKGRGEETVTIQPIPSQGPAVRWMAEAKSFSINALQSKTGVYIIVGSIQDTAGNFSNWSFKVTVSGDRGEDGQNSTSSDKNSINDNLPPILKAEDQIVQVGQSLKYTPIIESLRLYEVFIVSVYPTRPGGPVIGWLSQSNQFVIKATNNVGVYTVIGFIRDEIGNFSNWSFKVSVVAEPVPINPLKDPESRIHQRDDQAPRLVAEDHRIKRGNMAIHEPVIDNLMLNEKFSVSIFPIALEETSNQRGSSGGGQLAFPASFLALNFSQARLQNTQPTLIIWNEERHHFMIDASSSEVGSYEVIGKIQDENGNFSHWSFDITVYDESDTSTSTDSILNPPENPPVNPENPPVNPENPENPPENPENPPVNPENPPVDPPVDPPENPPVETDVLSRTVDAEAPTLTAQDQTVEIGGNLNYAPTIGNLRSGEGYTVTVSSVPTGAPAVTWDSTNARFAIQANSANLGQYSISGNIKDPSNNSNSWTFKITVTDTEAPTLTAQDQTVEIGRSITYKPIINNLRTNEGYTVTVRSISPTRAKPSVSWDSTNNRFSITGGDSSRKYTVSGTIQDENNNSSSWSFRITVTPLRDRQAPILTAQNKTVEIGHSTNLYHFPAISNLRANEGYTVTVSSVPTGAPTVTWDSTNNRFVINARSASLGQYNISGNIKDPSNNSRPWTFKITVVDTRAPILTAQNKTVEIGHSTNLYHSSAISNLRANEGYTVTVSSVPAGAPTITWDSTNNRFVINARSASLGQYNISGNIKDPSNNSRPWSFYITVVDTTAPRLTAQDRTVEISESINSAPVISNLRSNEGYTVTISSVSPTQEKPSVSWDSTNNRFSITGGDSLGNYTVSGTIQDENNNSSSWSFRITVTSATIPVLTVSNQAMGINKKIVHSPASISGVRADQSFTVTVESISPASPQALSVNWDTSQRRFSIRSGSKVGVYTVRGKIRKRRNFSSWSFTVTVNLNN